jgi:tripartite-type tricarboxylate transporter receptor subunit TctC
MRSTKPKRATSSKIKPLKNMIARLLLCLAAIALLSTAAFPQTYPDRPIRVVVPQPAGGASDAFARIIGMHMTQSMGQPIVVDNRAGASGIIGSEAVAKAAPDGYTILVTFGSHNLLPFVSKTLPFDAVKDFTPIIAAANTPFCLAINASLPAASMAEFVAYVRKNPGKVSYASAGAGSIAHLTGQLINLSSKIDMQHVPYKGGAPALADLVSGQIQAGIFTLATVTQYSRGGKLTVLGVIEQRRAKSAPEIPTLAEAGISGFPLPDSWLGMLGPAGMPEPIVKRLNAEIAAAIASPDVQEKMRSAGLEITGNTPEQFRQTIARNVESYRRLVAAARFTPE